MTPRVSKIFENSLLKGEESYISKEYKSNDHFIRFQVYLLYYHHIESATCTLPFFFLNLF